ncbi:hypothetical protein ACW2QC_01105 [Virgibacillus sp. FSP13]
MKKFFIIFPILFMLIGCSQKVTEEDLIGGNWTATAGYEDEEIGGEPNCYPFEEGIEFKDEVTAYNETYERDFEYDIRDKGSKITFLDKSRSYSYQIKKISQDEIVLEGLNFQEGRACTLERK